MIDNTDATKRSEVSSCQQVENNAPSSMVDDTEERMSLQDLGNPDDGITNLESKGSDSALEATMDLTLII